MDFVSHLDISDDAKAMLIVAGVEAMQRTCVPWSAREIEILQMTYSTGGAARCAEMMPRRTIGAIGFKARSLGLPRPPFKKRQTRFSTTPHIDAAIRRYYQGSPERGGLSKLAHQVGRPVAWVSSRANALSLAVPRFDSAKWSEDELALLHQHAAKIPQTISRIFRRQGFNRSPNSIHLKRTRLRCDRASDDTYTALGLAELLGADKSLVASWIRKGWLKAQTRGSGHPNDTYIIHHKNVRRFVIENVGAIDIRRADKFWLIDLLAGNS
jgi:hypothetical protein